MWSLRRPGLIPVTAAEKAPAPEREEVPNSATANSPIGASHLVVRDQMVPVFDRFFDTGGVSSADAR